MTDTYNEYLNSASLKAEHFLSRLDNDFSQTVNLTRLNRYEKDINTTMTVTTGTECFLSGYSTCFVDVPQYEDSSTNFGHTGRNITGVVKTGANTFYFFLPKSLLTESAVFNALGTLQLRLPIKSSTSGSMLIRVRSLYSNFTESSLYSNNQAIVANTVKFIEIPIAAYTMTNEAATFLGFEVFVYLTAFIGSTIKFDQLFIGEILPKRVENEFLSQPVKNNERRISAIEDIVEITPDINFIGDSTSFTGYGSKVATALGRNEKRFAYGGETSAQIYKHIATDVTFVKNNASVLLVGRNDYIGFTDTLFIDRVVNNTLKITNFLGHNRYIIACPYNGNYVGERYGEAGYNSFQALKVKLQQIYGHLFYDSIESLIQYYDYGGTVLVDDYTFVQPAVGSNVQITVNKTSFFLAGNTITIGERTLADYYTIISIDSATQMTIRLDTSNKIAPGGTVGNKVNSAFTITAYDELAIMRLDDFNSYNYHVAPATLRKDNIHLSDVVGITEFAKGITKKILQIKI